MKLVPKKRLSLILIFFGMTATLALAQMDIPVDPLTGRLLYSVPLWELNAGDLSVPIAAAYEGEGIKVAQGEGKFGMGWELSGAGAVSRVVRGLPDDYYEDTPTNDRRGWLHTGAAVSAANFTAPQGYSSCAQESADYTLINGWSYDRDTEPDLFTFSAPGLFGQFVLDASGDARLLDHQNLRIDYYPSGSTSLITSFTITKSNGTKYTFANGESVTRQAKKYNSGDQIDYFKTDYYLNIGQLGFKSKWFLTKIESQSGGEITYSYSGTTTETTKRDVIVYLPNGDEKKQYFVEDVTVSPIIRSISGGSLIVELDYINANRCVSKVSITDVDNNIIVKQYTPDYAFIKDANTTVHYPVTKLFLKSITERGDNCYSYPAFKFSYYGVNFYNGTTIVPYDSPDTNQDIWGYFNQTAENKKPTIYHYQSKTGTERFRLSEINSTPPTSTEPFIGTNRAVNPDKVTTGALWSIQLPSGGTTFIMYEPNEYSIPVGDSQYGPGIRVSRIWSHDAVSSNDYAVKSFEYEVENSSSTSGVMPYPPVFAFYNINQQVIRTADNMSPESIVQYKRVVVKTEGKGQTVYSYNIPAVFPTTSIGDWNATFSKVVRPSSPCPSLGILPNDYYSYPYPPNTNFDFERGTSDLILTQNESGQVVKINDLSYQRLDTSPVVINAVKYEKHSDNIIQYGQYKILANAANIMVSETTSIADLNDVTKVNTSTSTYEYDPTHFMLKASQTTNSDNIVHRTEFKYPIDFSAANPVGTEAINLKSMSDNNLWAPVLVSTKVNGNLTGSVLTLYNNFQYNSEDRWLPSKVLTNQANNLIEASLNGQQLSYNGYREESKVEEYNLLGKPITISDRSRIPKTTLYGYGGQSPVAIVSNAKYNEVAYEGFETSTEYDFTTSLTSDGITPWAGKKSMVITTPHSLDRAGLVVGKDKRYRFSARILGAATGQVNFKCYQSGVLKASGILDYGQEDLGNWVFKYGYIDLSGISGEYILKVSTTNSLRLDDILYHPQSASVTFESLTPGIGLVAQGNDRGQNIFWEYDHLGRLEKVRDQDKNITQLNGYYYVNQSGPPFTSEFYNNWNGPMVVGSNVTFTAFSSCADVTYKWYVNDVEQTQVGSSFQYQFTQATPHTIKLVVTEGVTGNTSTTSKTYSVKTPTGSGAPTVKLVADRTNIFNCDGYENTITASVLGCYDPNSFILEWEKKTCHDNNYMPVSGSNLSWNFDINVDTNGQPCFYSIRCRVVSICPTDAQSYTSAWKEIDITYTEVPEGMCE